jgi:hypothetical protein
MSHRRHIDVAKSGCFDDFPRANQEVASKADWAAQARRDSSQRNSIGRYCSFPMGCAEQLTIEAHHSRVDGSFILRTRALISITANGSRYNDTSICASEVDIEMPDFTRVLARCVWKWSPSGWIRLVSWAARCHPDERAVMCCFVVSRSVRARDRGQARWRRIDGPPGHRPGPITRRAGRRWRSRWGRGDGGTAPACPGRTVGVAW